MLIPTHAQHIQLYKSPTHFTLTTRKSQSPLTSFRLGLVDISNKIFSNFAFQSPEKAYSFQNFSFLNEMFNASIHIKKQLDSKQAWFSLFIVTICVIPNNFVLRLCDLVLCFFVYCMTSLLLGITEMRPFVLNKSKTKGLICLRDGSTVTYHYAITPACDSFTHLEDLNVYPSGFLTDARYVGEVKWQAEDSWRGWWSCFASYTRWLASVWFLLEFRLLE